MAWVDQSSIFGYEGYLTAIQMQNLRDNLQAICNGDAGAPTFSDSAYASGIFDYANKNAASLSAVMVNCGNVHDHAGGNGAAIQADGIEAACLTTPKIDFTPDTSVYSYHGLSGTLSLPDGWIHCWANIAGQGWGIGDASTVMALEMSVNGVWRDVIDYRSFAAGAGVGNGWRGGFFTYCQSGNARVIFSSSAVVLNYRRFQ